MKDSDPKNHTPAVISSLLDCEFLFVTGKGGVGKSVVSALIARVAAAQGKNCLIVYPGGAPGAEKLWGKPLGDTPRRVARRIFAVAIEPEMAMRQYVAEVLGSAKFASVLFHQRVSQGLLMGIPGPSDWAILGKAWSFTKTGVRDRERTDRVYDLVVLDGPASGDAAGMLRVPQVILDLAPAARLRKDAESCLRLLRDETRSRVVFVTLAEHLSISETEENLSTVRRELAIPVGPIFVNQLVTPRFSQKDRNYVLSRPAPTMPEGPPRSPEARAALCLNASLNQAVRERLKDTYMKRIHSWAIPTIELPRLADDVASLSELDRLQMTLAEGH